MDPEQAVFLKNYENFTTLYSFSRRVLRAHRASQSHRVLRRVRNLVGVTRPIRPDEYRKQMSRDRLRPP